MKILDETRGESSGIQGLWERKSNSYYLNRCLAITSRLQVMMEPHTYDLTLIANKRHRV